MKFPRNSKILRSQFDMAPFAAVFFIVMIFIMLGALMPVSGLPVRLSPPVADNLPGVDTRTVSMAVDSTGRFYFENQIVNESQLNTSLRAAVAGSRAPLTLVIHADRAVSYDQLAHLALLARNCAPTNGITNILLATLPRVTDAPARK